MQITIDNKVKLKKAPEDIIKNITEMLSIPNPKWMENNRMGRWNKGVPPRLEFYKKTHDTVIIPRALARWVILYCRNNQIEYSLLDRRRILPEIDFTFPTPLKPFQKEAVDTMLKKDFGTLNAPTGAGKTVMALNMIARRKQPATIIVHTKNLAFQWIDRIEEFLNIPSSEAGLIGCGKMIIGEKITVALVQSVYQRAKEIAKETGFLVVDECHRTPSRTFTDAVVAFDARFSLGLSATLFRRDNLSQLIFWHLGNTHYSVEPSRLIEDGNILSAEVIFRETKFIPHFDPTREYSKMLSELTVNDERNKLIVSDIFKETLKNPGVCLILSDRKKHCENLKTLLYYRHKIPSALLTGDVNNNKRSEIIKSLDKGEIKVLFATGQLIGEGFDCKNLSTLFLATPIKFSGRVRQYLGRVLRPAKGKKKARVFDYVDSNVPVLKNTAAIRRNAYGKGVTFRSESSIADRQPSE